MSSSCDESNTGGDSSNESLDRYDLDMDIAVKEDSPATFVKDCVAFVPQEELSKMKSLGEVIQSIPKPTKTGSEIIAEAIQAMPLEEREQVVRDLYGIEKSSTATTTCSHVQSYPATYMEPTEDPKFLATKLQEMEEHLKEVKEADDWDMKIAALELAESQNIAFTQDPKFRLKFLRCERFNVPKAVARFVRYFDWKLELFGEKKLTKDITYNDLTKEDKSMLKKGYLQRLPVRDRAGRAIYVAIFNGQTYESQDSLSRQYFWLFGNTDEETDKKGHIGIFFKIKDIKYKKDNIIRALKEYYRTGTDFPLCPTAYHKFMEREAGLMDKFVTFCLQVVQPELKSRSKIHYGKHSDWMTVLMSFGIPPDAIPFTQSYKIKTKNHLEYIAMRTTAEQLLAEQPTKYTSDQLIVLPSRKDVLLGKGKPIQFSSGNQGLSVVVDGYLDQYHKQSSKKEKTSLAADIVQMVKANGVRFLSKDKGLWMEVPDELAREKVSNMFRHQWQKTNASQTGTVRLEFDGVTLEPSKKARSE